MNLPFTQPINYTLITGAAGLPITLDEVKLWLKIPTTLTVDDNLITALIKSSASYFEKTTGRDLINKTYKTYLDKFPYHDTLSYYSGVSPLILSYNDNGIKLRKSKLQSITTIQYYIDEVLTTWDSSKYYFTDLPDYSSIYLVKGQTFPTVDIRKQAVIITFVAGYGADDTSVPDDVKQALLQFISYLYENRGDCASSDNMRASTDLFQQFIIVDF
jgi:hypothetical protein